MQKLRGGILRFFLLQKRFLKRKLYLLLLLVVPFLVLAMRIASSETAGVLTVAICRTGTDPAGSDALAEKLLSHEGVIRYVEAPSEEAGREMVRQKEADCLLILPPDLAQGLDDFLRGKNGALGIFVRSDTVFTRVLREHIYGQLTALLAERTGIRFLERQEIFDDIDRGALEEEFRSLMAARSFPDIFRISYVDNTAYESKGSDYLTSPLRGLLAVYLLLFSLASALFYLADMKNGIFAWMPFSRRPLFPFTYILIGTLPGTAAALIGLSLSGGFTVLWKELLLAGIYSLSCSAFAVILLTLLPDLRLLGAATPITLMFTLVVTPVFMDFKTLAPIQHLLPTYYYLAGTYSNAYVIRGIFYFLIIFAIGALLLLIRKRRPGKL